MLGQVTISYRKKGGDMRFYGWRYGCSEEMYYFRGNQR